MMKRIENSLYSFFQVDCSNSPSPWGLDLWYVSLSSSAREEKRTFLFFICFLVWFFKTSPTGVGVFQMDCCLFYYFIRNSLGGVLSNQLWLRIYWVRAVYIGRCATTKTFQHTSLYSHNHSSKTRPAQTIHSHTQGCTNTMMHTHTLGAVPRLKDAHKDIVDDTQTPW